MWVPRELEQIAPQRRYGAVFNLEEALEGRRRYCGAPGANGTVARARTLGE